MAEGLTVFTPAYNEANRLNRTPLQIKSFLDSLQQPFDVWVIDDDAKDETRQVVKSFQKANPAFTLFLNPERPNKGKGYSVKEGFQLAG